MGKPTTCGHQPHHCKGLCKKCYFAAYYAANRERIKTAAKVWREMHPGAAQEKNRARLALDPEAARAYQREYHTRNAEARRAKAALWKRENPERARELSRAASNRRRGRALNGADLTNEQWVSILIEFDYRCAYCNAGGVPLEMEHMTPLVRGGRHTWANVVPACGPCNRRKHTRTALEFIGP